MVNGNAKDFSKTHELQFYTVHYSKENEGFLKKVTGLKRYCSLILTSSSFDHPVIASLFSIKPLSHQIVLFAVLLQRCVY